MEFSNSWLSCQECSPPPPSGTHFCIASKRKWQRWLQLSQWCTLSRSLQCRLLQILHFQKSKFHWLATHTHFHSSSSWKPMCTWGILPSLRNRARTALQEEYINRMYNLNILIGSKFGSEMQRKSSRVSCRGRTDRWINNSCRCTRRIALWNCISSKPVRSFGSCYLSSKNTQAGRTDIVLGKRKQSNREDMFGRWRRQ